MSGAIDVALLAAPASLLAIKGGVRVLGNPDTLAPYPLSGLATTEKKLAEQRADVRKTLRAYLKAVQLMQRDEDATVGAIRDFLNVDEEVARGSYRFLRDTTSLDGTTPEAGIRLIIDIERTAIGTTEDLPLSTGVDFSVLQEGSAGVEWRGARQRDTVSACSRAMSRGLVVGLLIAVACSPPTPQGQHPPDGTEREDAVLAAPQGRGVATTRSLLPIRLAFIGRSIQQLPVSVAEATGIMAEEGLQLDVTYMNSATLTTAAVLNGEIDLLSGMGPGVRGALQGLPMRAVVAGERGTSYSLIARPEVHDIADLRGGKIGTSAIGSGDYHVLVELFRRHGMDPQNDLTLLSVGGTTTRYTALTNGAIDAGLLSPPPSIFAERQGLRILAEPRDLLPYPSMGLTTTVEKLTADRPLVKAGLRAYVRGLQRIRTDRDSTVAVIRELLDMDQETAVGTYEFALATLSQDGTVPENVLRVMAEIERTSLGIAEDVPFTTGFDFSLVDEIRHELGLAASSP
jgi:ABC-type nitrate/sulfonate/bicarbonate transport system substrate-binding protein